MVETKAWSDSKNATESAAALSPIAGVPAEQMVASVAGSSIYEVPVARGLNYDQAQAVRKLGLRGVRLMASSRRVYPEGNLGAQLLGFVGQDNSGLTGLESDLNDVLGGAHGTLTYERDGLGKQLAAGEKQAAAGPGEANMALTNEPYNHPLPENQ